MFERIFSGLIGRFGFSGAGWLLLACAAALAALCAVAGWTINGWRLASSLSELQSGWDRERAALAEAAAADIQAAREEERRAAQGIHAADSNFQKEKTHAAQQEADLLARLRTDAVRLRQQWRGCETSRVSEAAARPGVPDGDAGLRIESAGRIIRAAAECDAHVRGLQAALKAERNDD